MADFVEVESSWAREHPGAVVGVLGVSGVDQSEGAPELEKVVAAIEKDLAARFPDRAAIRATEPIPAYTAYYKRFKKTYQVAQQVESVALKGRRIPRRPPLVMAMFAAELKNHILTAGHDRRSLQGGVRLVSAQGGESFIRMGGEEKRIKAGDMFMADQAGVIADVIYGPDERTKIGPQTGEALFVAYAPPGVGPERVLAHLRDIEGYCRLISSGAEQDFFELHLAG